MCGIFGIINEDKKLHYNKNFYAEIFKSLNHRGPDFQSSFEDQENKIILFHSRLSIIDITKNGNQPMVSSSGRYVIVYNGEIYNHLKLREKLKNEFNFCEWKRTSDTETLLELFENYSFKDTLNQIDGMFAFCLYDKKNKQLYLVRDRIGEKPLYFGFVNNDFLFSSELKSIKKHPEFKKKISRFALNDFFNFGYIKSPYSIYENIFKLPPGNFINIDLRNKLNQYKDHNLIKNFFSSYWNVEQDYQSLKESDVESYSSFKNNLKNNLRESVSSQLISDVPIGCFLSGGIDSSLISCLMQEVSLNKIKTFTIGFKDKIFDESIFAKKIANHLKTEHHELILNVNDTLDDINNLYKIYDEPFADSSQIPTLAVSRLASKEVKAVLSGDGGDELFGGYNRYFMVSPLWQKIKLLPYNIRKILGTLIMHSPSSFYSLFKFLNFNNIEDKVKKIGSRLSYLQNKKELYESLIRQWDPNEKILLDNFDQNLNSTFSNNINFEEMMMIKDKQSYLPDDILCKVDRASMFNSLETRAPFLSKKILELSAKCPLKYKISNNSGKIILKDILRDYLPKNLSERPKMGFGIPLKEWLKNDKVDNYVSQTLDIKKLKKDNIINTEYLEKILIEHKSGKRNWEHKIWSVLTFQNWYNNQ